VQEMVKVSIFIIIRCIFLVEIVILWPSMTCMYLTLPKVSKVFKYINLIEALITMIFILNNHL